MSTFDINILPLNRQKGSDYPDIPGLYAAAPPRKTARGRATDQLILFLNWVGDAQLSEEQQNQILVRLAQVFYKTPGTVTAAMRATAGLLNELLLEWNLQNASSARQGVGFFTQVVLHGENAYLGLSGPGHAFLIRMQDMQQFHDPQGSGRGLGVSRTPTVRYFQLVLQPNDFLLLSHQPPEGWLAEGGPAAPGQGLEGMRRRLLLKAGQDCHAVLIQIQAGAGRMRLLRLKPAFKDMARPAGGGAQQAIGALSPAPAKPAATRMEEGEKPQAAPGSLKAVEPDQKAGLPEVEDKPADMEEAVESLKRTAQAVQPTMEPSAAASRAAKPPAARPLKPARKPLKETKLVQGMQQFFAGMFKAFQVFGKAFGNALHQVFGWLHGLLRRILPDETLLNISPATMVFFALAIPLIISVIGGMVYIERGQSQQYQALFEQAYQQAEAATAKTDPAEQRTGWQSALAYLDQAELYRITEQSQALRNQVNASLDQLDAIERLDFQAALSEPLERYVKVTRLAATTSELYLLDSAQGSILRAVLTPGGYDLDEGFSCSPATAPMPIGPLIDLALSPDEGPSGTIVLGIDLNGNLMTCTPGKSPIVTALAPPPVNFGNPKAFALDAGDLFVIDPPKRAIWVYRDRAIDQPPNQYLGDITSFMLDVIDLAVNYDDVYLLHANGKITKCTYSDFPGVPTRCENPLPYTDERPGRQGGEVIPDALFDQIYFFPPPGPSLYLLDPQNQAVYHFSLRLKLDRQYRAREPLSIRPATAFTISPTRLLFMAFDSEVYYATLP